MREWSAAVPQHASGAREGGLEGGGIAADVGLGSIVVWKACAWQLTVTARVRPPEHGAAFAVLSFHVCDLVLRAVRCSQRA